MKGHQNIVKSKLGADVRFTIADGRTVTVPCNGRRDRETEFPSDVYALLLANESFKAHVAVGHLVLVGDAEKGKGKADAGAKPAAATVAQETKTAPEAKPASDTKESEASPASSDGEGKAANDADFWAEAEAAAKGEGTKRRGGRGSTKANG